jgi:hypothetical protein
MRWFHEGEENRPDGRGAMTRRRGEVAQLDVCEVAGGARQRAVALAKDGGIMAARHEQEDEVEWAKLGRLGCLANFSHEEK